MKTNRMMRLASGLLICVLLTTSVIGGTFAKYTTQATAKGEARVAKWGVTFTAGSDLFAASYTGTGANSATVTVQTTAADTKLVAPGTEGTGFDLSAQIADDKKPEVSYVVEIKLDGTPKVPTLKYKTDGTGASEATYEPIKFDIYNGSTAIKEDATLTDLTTGIYYIYDVATDKYYMDDDRDGVLDDSEKASGKETSPEIKIKWKWKIESATDGALNSKLDTILGDKAAGMEVTDATKYKLPTGIASVTAADIDVSLDWTMTATQID